MMYGITMILVHEAMDLNLESFMVGEALNVSGPRPKGFVSRSVYRQKAVGNCPLFCPMYVHQSLILPYTCSRAA